MPSIFNGIDISSLNKSPDIMADTLLAQANKNEPYGVIISRQAIYQIVRCIRGLQATQQKTLKLNFNQPTRSKDHD